jgi:putative oxidoreductase
MKMEKLQAPLVLLARLMLVFIFIIEGWGKIGNYAGVQEYMESHGVPGMLLPLVILTELGGGLLVAFGLVTRLAALALAGFCVLAALFFHHDLANADEFMQFTKDMAIAGGFLGLVAFGAGEWSIDGLWRRQRSSVRIS